MSALPPLVDIHCHLLPQMDDGAGSWSESLAMARMAVADGITTVVATPHQLGAHAKNSGEVIRARTTELRQLLQQENVPLAVLPGADVRIEPELVARLRGGEVLTLGDLGRHVLLELPHELYLPLDRVLGDLKLAGTVAILSHPERNLGILANRDVLLPLVAAGCLLQITAGALIGTFGPQAQKLAEWLVRQRLAHFVATDAHGIKSRRPLLRRAFDAVVALAGYETAVDLCCRNPAAVAAGQAVAARGRSASWPEPNGWLWRKKAG